MELTELQSMWTRYDRHITENIRINKEILRKLILSGPSNKLKRMKLIYIARMVISWGLMIYLSTSLTNKDGIVIICFILMLLGLYQQLKYIYLLNKIDFSRPVFEIRENVLRWQKYQMRINDKRWYLLLIPMLFFIFLTSNISFFSMESLFVIAIISLAFIAKIIIESINNRKNFSDLNKAIKELEDLEK